MSLYPFLKNRALFFILFILLTIDENTDTAHLTEGFVL